MVFTPKGSLARARQAAPREALQASSAPARAISMSPAMAASYAARKAASDAFRPSVEQRAYYDWLERGTGSAILRASAGSGKSTTLVRGLPFMEGGNVFFTAFGKDAAEEVRTKARALRVDRQGISFGTVHAAGYRRLVDLYPRLKYSKGVDDRKTGALIDMMAALHSHRRGQIMESKGFIAKLVSYAKQMLIGCPGYPTIGDENEWLRLVDHFSLDQDLADNVPIEEGIAWAQTILAQGIDQHQDKIDFDDMLYMPIWLNLRMFPNDWVLLDEVQDTNPARRELARKLLKPGGRFVGVGDDRQNIFAFTGSEHDGMDITARLFDCEELRLSVSYRCPINVVKYVKEAIDPEYMIEAHPSAPEGIVRSVNYKTDDKCTECEGEGHHMIMSEFPVPCKTCRDPKYVAYPRPWFVQDKPDAESFVLCRYTKPLLTTAYAMIREGIACKVEGRDIGRGLIALATRWRSNSIDRLEERLKQYEKREIDKATAAENDQRLQQIEDKIGSLRIFIDRCRLLKKHSIDELVAEINSMFGDKVEKMITLSTGHRAKGLERPRVYWLETAIRGRLKKDWERISERNIKIVIATRSQRELILVPEDIHTVKKDKKND